MKFKTVAYFIILTFLSLSNAQNETSSSKEKNQDQAQSQALNLKQLELFNKILYIIESQYYQKVDSKVLIENAIRGMMNSLDPHSTYLNLDMFKKIENDTKGEYEGIGIELTVKDNALLIVTVVEDTPAYKAGIRAGDKIIEVNGKSVIGHSLDAVVSKMKGSIGEVLKLSVVRQGKQGKLDFNVKREIIKVKAVKSKIIDQNYVSLKITQFQKKAAENLDEELEKAKKELKEKGGIKGIVLDLRGNPGGLLDQAVEISSRFLESGIVVSTENRNGETIEVKYVTKSSKKDTATPLVVLINGSSASASEIVAGALQDHKRAVIMGETSFGKGSVQSLLQVDNENALKLTIAQYLTPLKRKIQAIGIKPDVVIEDINVEGSKENQKKLRTLREKDLDKHLKGIGEDEGPSGNESSEKEKEESNFQDYQLTQAVNYLKTLDILKK